MSPEIAVLAGNEGVDQVLWQLRDGNQLAFLVRYELGNQATIDIEDAGRQCRVEVAKILFSHDVLGGSDSHTSQDAEHQGREYGNSRNY